VITPHIALESGIDFVARENRSGQPGSALMLRRLTIYSVAVGNSCTSTIASAEQVAGASAAPFTDEASWRAESFESLSVTLLRTTRKCANT